MKGGQHPGKLWTLPHVFSPGDPAVFETSTILMSFAVAYPAIASSCRVKPSPSI